MHRPAPLAGALALRALRLSSLTGARRARVLLVAALVALAAAAVPAGASAASRFTAKASSGGTTAVVTGSVKKRDGVSIYSGATLTISAHGKVLRRPLAGLAAESYAYRPTPRVADVSGDAIPDVLVDTFSGGAHCCTVATIAVATGKGKWAKPWRAAFDGGYRLRDLGTGDGTYEIVAVDPRFDYAFASHAESARPVMISHANADGSFADVAKQFPDRVRVDADFWKSEWAKLGPVAGESADDAEARGYGARSTLAATLADLLTLGALDEAKQLSAQSVARGDFAHLPASADAGFDTDVAHKLQEWGFLSDWSVLGLPQ